MLVNWSNGKVLDVSDSADEDGAALCVWDSNGGANQKWRLQPVEGLEEVYTLVSTLEGARVVDLEGASGDDGARVMLCSDNGGANQQWRIVYYEDGTCGLQSMSSEKMIDLAEDGSVIQWGLSEAETSPGQYWFLLRVGD